MSEIEESSELIVKKDLFKKKLCTFFADGKCKKGDSCTFLHETQKNKKTVMCKNYQNGNCKYGDNCNFKHTKLNIEDLLNTIENLIIDSRTNPLNGVENLNKIKSLASV
jgi:hypothetical protein